jgi:murein L,D-transpeptidase YcbB/YkuD
MHPGLLVAGAVGALALFGRRRPSPAAPTTAEEAARIVRESKEIVNGERDAYSDAPSVPVTPREAAERTGEAIRAASELPNVDAELAAALAAARAAAQAEAAQAVQAAPTSPVLGPITVKPAAPKPAAPKPAAPVTRPAAPPAGYDRTKAANSAGDLARHITQKKYDYTRKALGAWQIVAGIPSDGVYGPAARNALAFYVGNAAPRPLFVKNAKTGVPYPNTPYPWGK